MHPGESILEDDSDSERHILEGDEDRVPGIMKTTKVTVLEETEGPNQKVSQESLQKQSQDWMSPDLERGVAQAR